MCSSDLADPGQPGISELLDAIAKQAMPPRTDALARRIVWRLAVSLAQAARNPATTPEIAALLGERVHALGEDLSKRKGDADERAWAAQLARDLLDAAALEKLATERPRTTDIPQGDPIGEADWLGSPEP